MRSSMYATYCMTRLRLQRVCVQKSRLSAQRVKGGKQLLLRLSGIRMCAIRLKITGRRQISCLLSHPGDKAPLSAWLTVCRMSFRRSQKPSICFGCDAGGFTHSIVALLIIGQSERWPLTPGQLCGACRTEAAHVQPTLITPCPSSALLLGWADKISYELRFKFLKEREK